MRVSFAPLDAEATLFISDRMGIDFTPAMHSPHWFCCTARDDGGIIMGVMACEFRHWFDAHFNCAIDDPRCMNRTLLQAIFSTLFWQATRVSAEVDPANSRAIRQMQRLGFEIEGYLRKGYDGQRDAIVYGMLAEDCRFLSATSSRETRHGQGSEDTRPLRGRGRTDTGQ